MKIAILIGALLIGCAMAQNSTKPTKHPKPTKPPKTGPVISCSNITRYEPRTCCPSFPKIEVKETKKCDRQCAQQNNSHICCVANCTLNEVKGINADGTFNVKPLTDFFVKYSNSKNKTVYTSLVTDIVQKCIAGLSSNAACPPAEVAFCVYRQLFFQCPDLKNNTLCNAVKDAAQNCPGYPFIAASEKPNSSKGNSKPAEKKENAKKNEEKKPKGNDKKNKNQGVNVPNGQNNTTANPTTGNNTSVKPNKVQKGNAKEIKFPQTTQTTTTSNGKSTTHKSESKDGALGAKGPGFQP